MLGMSSPFSNYTNALLIGLAWRMDSCVDKAMLSSDLTKNADDSARRSGSRVVKRILIAMCASHEVQSVTTEELFSSAIATSSHFAVSSGV